MTSKFQTACNESSYSMNLTDVVWFDMGALETWFYPDSFIKISPSIYYRQYGPVQALKCAHVYLKQELPTKYTVRE